MEVVVIATTNLRIQVKQQYSPVYNADVKLYQTISGKQSIITSGKTDEQGMFYAQNLITPPKELSLQKDVQIRPYAQYHIEVSLNGYDTEVIRNIQVFEDNDSLLTIQISESETNIPKRNIQNLGDHRLFQGDIYA